MDGAVQVRNSHDPDGPIWIHAPEWDAFLAGANQREFDRPLS